MFQVFANQVTYYHDIDNYMAIIDVMISIILHITSFGENFYQFNEVIVKVISYKKEVLYGTNV